MSLSQNRQGMRTNVLIIEVIVLLCFFLLKHDGMFLYLFGLLLFGLIPSIGIIGILLNNSRSVDISRQILKFNITCQIIVVSLPLLLFLFSFLFTNNREQPPFLPIAAFCMATVVLFCIILSIVSNIVHAIIVQKSMRWEVLLQFIYLGFAFYTLYLGQKIFQY